MGSGAASTSVGGWTADKPVVVGVGGSFYISCTLDTCLDVIGQCLV